jgi:aminopeptidase N
MRPRRVSLILFGLLAVTASALEAQSNAERVTNDRYSRSHDYDLLHQRIELRRFDWDHASFAGRVITRLRALRPAFDSVILDAGARLDITAVRSGTATLEFTHVRDTLVVRLPRPLRIGDSITFTVDYQGHVKNGAGLTFIEADSGDPPRPQQIWSQGEADNNHHWFPTYDFPNDKLTWELVATVPAAFTVVSNGRLVSDRRHRNGTRTVHWSQERPAVSYLVSLVVAPLVRIADRWRQVPVEYFVYREDSSLARPLFGVTPDMMSAYSRLTGES